MFCSKCGNQIPDDAKFCPVCGFESTNQNKVERPPQDPLEPEQPPVTPKKKVSKVYLIVGVIVIAVVVVVALIINSNAKTKEMRTALKNNDATAIYNIYQWGIGDEKLIGKYEKLISEKISEISEDISTYDCSEEAKTEGSDAFEEYLCSTYGDLFDGDDYTLEDSIFGDSTEVEYNELLGLIESKEDYYDGIYYYSNADDVYDYEEAIECFSSVKENDSNYETALEKTTECSELYMEMTLKNVDEYVESDDVSGAIELLNSAKEYFDSVGLDSTEIQSKLDTTIATYAKKYADKAKAAFKEKDINTALGNIEAAIELQPDNADYQAKKNEYELYLPFELYLDENVLKYEKNDDFFGFLYMDHTYTANDGSEKPHSIKWYNNNDILASTSAIYSLQGKYDIVTGQIFLFAEDKSTDDEGYFVVYGDGKKIYTSPKVTGGVLPQNVSFEVSDVQTLEIAFFGQDSSSRWGASHFGVSNLVAQKAFPESAE